MQKRIIGVHANSYHGYGVVDAIKGISAAGFSYVEMVGVKGWTEHVYMDQSFLSLCDTRDLLERYGLDAFSLSGHVNLLDSARLDDFRVNMQLAQFFGSRYIVTSVGEAHFGENEVQDDELLAKTLRSLVPDLEKYGLTLALELHGEHNTGAVLKEVVDKVGSPRVVVNYDTANAIFYGKVDPAKDILTCMDVLGYVHLKDKAGAQDEWNFPALGKGYVDFPAILAELDSAGNNAPLSIEIEFTQDGPKDLAEIDQAVLDSAAYLRSIGVTF